MNSYSVNSIFKAQNVALDPIIGEGSEAEFEATLNGSREIYALVNLPTNANGSHKLVLKSAEGGKDIEIPLVNAKLNFIRLTDKGFVNAEGKGAFKFVTTHSNGIVGLGASMCIIRYTPVVSH